MKRKPKILDKVKANSCMMCSKRSRHEKRTSRRFKESLKKNHPLSNKTYIKRKKSEKRFKSDTKKHLGMRFKRCLTLSKKRIMTVKLQADRLLKFWTKKSPGCMKKSRVSSNKEKRQFISSRIRLLRSNRLFSSKLPKRLQKEKKLKKSSFLYLRRLVLERNVA